MEKIDELPAEYQDLIDGFKEGKVRSSTLTSWIASVAFLGFTDEEALTTLIRAILFEDSQEARLIVVNRDGVIFNPTDRVHALRIVVTCLQRGWKIGNRILSEEKVISLTEAYMEAIVGHMRAGGTLPTEVRNNLRGLLG